MAADVAAVVGPVGAGRTLELLGPVGVKLVVVFGFLGQHVFRFDDDRTDLHVLFTPHVGVLKAPLGHGGPGLLRAQLDQLGVRVHVANMLVHIPFPIGATAALGALEGAAALGGDGRVAYGGREGGRGRGVVLLLLLVGVGSVAQIGWVKRSKHAQHVDGGQLVRDAVKRHLSGQVAPLVLQVLLREHLEVGLEVVAQRLPRLLLLHHDHVQLQRGVFLLDVFAHVPGPVGPLPAVRTLKALQVLVNLHVTLEFGRGLAGEGAVGAQVGPLLPAVFGR